MRLYLDTSLIVSALVHEEASPTVHDWLADRARFRFAISDWVLTEFSAALSRKLLMRQISAGLREEAQFEFDALVARQFDILPVIREQFGMAADFAHRSAHGLRAGDALHLAIARTHALTLCTRDIKLATAGVSLGCPTELVASRR